MGQVGTELLHRSLTAPAEAVPHLGAGFFGVHEQHIALPLRPVRQEQRHRIGLIEASEIPKIAVLPERPLAISVMRHQRGRRDHCSGSAQGLEETGAALGVHGWADQHGSERG